MRLFLFQSVLITAAMLSSVFTSVGLAADSVVDLTKIDRSIGREPKYQSQPHYALLVFGPQAKQRSWFVIDGDNVAYIDRNGNGDLTDAGERVELDVEATNKIRLGDTNVYKAMHVFSLGEVRGTKLNFRLWVRNPDFDASKDDVYRDRFREWDQKKWINGSLMCSAQQGAASQNPLLLTIRPEEAQITRFGGPVTASLKWGKRQILEPWPKQTVFDVHLGYRNLLAKDCDYQSFEYTRLSIRQVPESIQPVATFEFSSGSTGEKAITRTIRLDQRCCGDTFYANMTLPKKATKGTAKVTVRFPDWTGQGVETAVFEIPINQKPSKRSEATYIMFHRPEIQIADAVNVLRKRGLDVSILPEVLLIRKDGTNAFGVRLVRSANVQEIASILGQGTKHAAGLKKCDARFEIAMIDLEKVLKDRSTLREIQSTLQELTQGYLYQTWNKKLSSSGKP